MFLGNRWIEIIGYSIEWLERRHFQWFFQGHLANLHSHKTVIILRPHIASLPLRCFFPLVLSFTRLVSLDAGRRKKEEIEFGRKKKRQKLLDARNENLTRFSPSIAPSTTDNHAKHLCTSHKHHLSTSSRLSHQIITQSLSFPIYIFNLTHSLSCAFFHPVALQQ